MFAIWSVSLGLFLAATALSADDPAFVAPIVLAGTVALAAVFVHAVRRTGDLINPISVIVLLGTVRFTLPWVLISLGVESRNVFFRLLGLQPIDWQRGELLALVGLLAFALGWMLVSDRGMHTGRISFALPDGVQYSALAGMALGLAFLVLFLGGNVASIATVVVEGTFRGVTVTEGTGVFFYLALLLPASSVVLCAFWLLRGRRVAAFSAVLVSTLAFFTLGGRARAAVAVIAGLLLVWYLRRRRTARTRSRRPRIVLVLGGALLSLVLLYVGAVYRGNPRLPEGGVASTGGVEAYASFGFILDIGHLHALAAATSLEPGVLGGQTLLGPLTFPFTEMLGITERSSGVFIVEETMGFGPGARTWGLDSALMGDAYLNLGVPGVVVLCVVFGMALKGFYRRFREGGVHAAVYVLGMIYSIRVAFESIEKWGEMLTVLAFATGVIHVSSVFAAREPPRLRPELAATSDRSRSMP